jgi:hypothetical protein
MNVKTLKTLFVMLFFIGASHVTLSQTTSELRRYDIIINEVMAKPAPTIGLPAVEYIELHNRLPHPVSLNNWKLNVGNTVKKLPIINLDSCGYVVIIAQKYEEDFAPYCDRIVTLSSLSITDGGQALTLYNEDGEVIHSVSFKSSWHSEKIKQEGGWSLEMIDEGWSCAGSWNWDSSIDPGGGTPGKPNSIRNTLYNNDIPAISGVTMVDTTTLRVHFTKTLTEDVLNNAELFRTDPYINIQKISEVPPNFASLDIRFAEALQHGICYQLHLSGVMQDCGGNRYSVQEDVPFGVAVPPKRDDLVINEILTNPLDGKAADYLEIYNRSEHIIDLKDIKVGYGGDTLPQKAITAASKGWQLLPKSYVALCKQREVTLQQYICKDESRLLECDSLPDFAIGEGIIHLTDRSLRPIDKFAYTEEMHYPKLLTTKGVSLERLYPDMPTQDESNWRSAAEDAGFGTPGYQNSQSGSALETNEFEIIPNVFSPDNDGFEDFAEIICSFKEEENRTTVTIYNNHGHPIKHLANNVLCGAKARFRWDGDDDRLQSAPAGMYVVQIESWNLRSQKALRKRIVVSIYR